MGFAGGAVGFQRFFIEGAFPSVVDDGLLAKLGERTFGKLAALPDGAHLGWIGPSHLFETELRPERIAYGRFALLALRIDVTRIPPQVVKAYQAVEVEVARQASGREFLSKGELRAAQQAGAERAEQEARGGAFRKMSSYPVLIDLEHKTVYLGSASLGVADHLVKLFYDTFGRGLAPADPGRLALRLMTPAGKARALENLAASQFVKPPAEDREAALELPAGELAFLGAEFLMWLWWQVDAEDEPVALHGGDALAIAFETTLKLKCVFSLTGTTAITADAPAGLPEARAAVRIGKQPVRAGLVVGAPGGEFRLTLDAARFAVSGLQLPEPAEASNKRRFVAGGDGDGDEGGGAAVRSAADRRAQLEERFENIADAADLLDAVYGAFLHVRLSREWGGVTRRIGEWAAGRGSDGLKLVSAAGA